jgi:hypothetical protein
MSLSKAVTSPLLSHLFILFKGRCKKEMDLKCC